ncbi:hypothetical protein ACF0H5_005324 [Mactra antiquata]
MLWVLLLLCSVAGDRDKSSFLGGTISYTTTLDTNGKYKADVELITGWILGNGPCGPSCTNTSIGTSTLSTRKQLESVDPNVFGKFFVDSNEYCAGVDCVDYTIKHSMTEEVYALNAEARWEQDISKFSVIVDEKTEDIKVKLNEVTTLKMAVSDPDGDVVKCFIAEYVEGGDISSHKAPGLVVNEFMVNILKQLEVPRYVSPTPPNRHQYVLYIGVTWTIDLYAVASENTIDSDEDWCVLFEVLNPCISNPCRNSAACSVDKRTGTFLCHCLPDYFGKSCENFNLIILNTCTYRRSTDNPDRKHIICVTPTIDRKMSPELDIETIIRPVKVSEDVEGVTGVHYSQLIVKGKITSTTGQYACIIASAGKHVISTSKDVVVFAPHECGNDTSTISTTFFASTAKPDTLQCVLNQPCSVASIIAGSFSGGSRCDISVWIPEHEGCRWLQCKNNGFCDGRDANNPFCICPRGYSGPTCDKGCYLLLLIEALIDLTIIDYVIIYLYKEG